MSMNDKDGGPAFPREDYQTDRAPGQHGMSLRDWFAGQALAGMLAGDKTESGAWSAFALDAYNAADAMLKEREKS